MKHNVAIVNWLHLCLGLVPVFWSSKRSYVDLSDVEESEIASKINFEVYTIALKFGTSFNSIICASAYAAYIEHISQLPLFKESFIKKWHRFVKRYRDKRLWY